MPSVVRSSLGFTLAIIRKRSRCPEQASRLNFVMVRHYIRWNNPEIRQSQITPEHPHHSNYILTRHDCRPRRIPLTARVATCSDSGNAASDASPRKIFRAPVIPAMAFLCFRTSSIFDTRVVCWRGAMNTSCLSSACCFPHDDPLNPI